MAVVDGLSDLPRICYGGVWQLLAEWGGGCMKVM